MYFPFIWTQRIKQGVYALVVSLLFLCVSAVQHIDRKKKGKKDKTKSRNQQIACCDRRLRLTMEQFQFSIKKMSLNVKEIMQLH